MDVHMRFGAVTGVAAPTKHLANLQVLTGKNLYAAVLEMAECNDDAAAVDQDVVAGQRPPTNCDSASLGQRVGNRR